MIYSHSWASSEGVETKGKVWYLHKNIEIAIICMSSIFFKQISEETREV
jgi:hypothetical protein